ncbi:hypothetical protein EV421DRAFT_1739829 [Armillaria borealis]|uniref:GH16 domain-containing protein n=1 Tax=Armillaria borealis TaxID=47425 RepID=A0AA39MJB3_9AGAR|nr:hypothetical protein EV421DRAFT_1739829 [Armillaria borealis]
MARHQEEWTRREPRRNKIRHCAATLFITDNIKTQELFACVVNSHQQYENAENDDSNIENINYRMEPNHSLPIYYNVAPSTPTSNASPPTSTSNPHPSIHYASGAIHAKGHITVTAGNSYTIYGEFSAPTVVGAWPAFWLTAVAGWPPEADIGEWKGTANDWYNTFATLKSTLVGWPTDLSFHSLKAVLTAESNGDDVKIDFYMDGEFKVTQYGQGFVGSALYLVCWLLSLESDAVLIGKYQMEGSSVTPGPKGTTTFKIRNVEVTRTGS